MLKKRLVFTLLLQDCIIQLSRNFSLQAVGDLDWLFNHYDFDSIAYSVDELVLLNVGRNSKNNEKFIDSIVSISSKCFMPIAAGGGIVCMDDAYRIFDAGADKLVINSILFDNPSLVVDMVKTFGSQSIVASIDYKRINSSTEVFILNGGSPTGFTVEAAVEKVEQLGVGEIYLTSMDRDGTGQGYDLTLLESIVTQCQVPIIASGGVGNFDHFVSGMKIDNVTATSTANIFNFVGEGLAEARKHIQANGIKLANWYIADFDSLVK